MNSILGSRTDSKTESIIALASRYDYDSAHAHQVECLAGTLFMELSPLHKLAKEDRKLLEYAAILHDIGHFLSDKSHHKHALQLIMMEPLPEFSRSEKLIIANTARYHRKAWPNPLHTAYAILTDRERQRVDLLVPLLRIADALDKSHRNMVRELSCKIDTNTETVVCRIGTAGGGDAVAELAACELRYDLFRSYYNFNFRVELTTKPADAELAKV